MSNISYDAFDDLSPENRVKFNDALLSLLILAKNIETYADEQFNKGS